MRDRVRTEWNPNLAYAIGLIASDGNLSPDGRHIAFTSKDLEMVQNFQAALRSDFSIGRKSRGGETQKKYYVVQFSDVRFSRFLLSIGLTPAKSRTMGPLIIPDPLFADFLRGCIDGDGNIQAYQHPESKHPQIKVSLCSGSLDFLQWVHDTVVRTMKVEGGSIYTHPRKDIHTLSFGKSASLKLFQSMYSVQDCLSLTRKRRIAEQIFEAIIAGASG